VAKAAASASDADARGADALNEQAVSAATERLESSGRWSET
jgi:hypothetical protein